ncbi:MAG TPA: hypothetical protein DCZ13_11260 [Porticoccaceae bacterium]|nr:hypothetical protein [Porticoccaceae bacterium]
MAPVGISTDAQASADDVVQLIRQIRQQNIRAVFVENITDPRLITQIGRKIDIRVSGSLYSDALPPPSGPAASYLSIIHRSIMLISKALQPPIRMIP